MTNIKVTLKAAATLDGKIATKTGQSKWITGEEARAAGHLLRSQHDAILVGINTVLADDPRLTTRGIQGGKSPIRIILDSQCRLSLKNACLKNDGIQCIIVVGTHCLDEKIEELKSKTIHILKAPTPRPQIKWLLPQLSKYNIKSILVEGGSQIHASFIQEQSADHLVLFLSGKLFGQDAALSWCGELNCLHIDNAPQLKINSMSMVGEDIAIHADFTKYNL